MTTSSSSLPPCFFRFEPVYKTGPDAGPWLIEGLGRPAAGVGAANASVEFNSSQQTPSAILEGPLAGTAWPEAVSAHGADLAGRRGLLLGEAGYELAAEFYAADLVDSPVFTPREKKDKEESAPGPIAPLHAVAVLDARPGSRIYYGRRPGLSRDDFLSLFKRKPATSLLADSRARPGQVFIAPAGAPYALGKGVMAFRVAVSPADLYGERPRTPRTEAVSPQGLFIKSAGYVEKGNAIVHLFASDTVRALRLDLGNEWTDRWPAPGPRPSFMILTCLSGSALLNSGGETEAVSRGMTVVVAAHCQSFRINPGPEGAAILRVWVPGEDAEDDLELESRGLGRREIEGLYGFGGENR